MYVPSTDYVTQIVGLWFFSWARQTFEHRPFRRTWKWSDKFEVVKNLAESQIISHGLDSSWVERLALMLLIRRI